MKREPPFANWHICFIWLLAWTNDQHTWYLGIWFRRKTVSYFEAHRTWWEWTVPIWLHTIQNHRGFTFIIPPPSGWDRIGRENCHVPLAHRYYHIFKCCNSKSPCDDDSLPFHVFRVGLFQGVVSEMTLLLECSSKKSSIARWGAQTDLGAAQTSASLKWLFQWGGHST